MSLFKNNEGYFIIKRLDYKESTPHIKFELCQGYRLLWYHLYRVIKTLNSVEELDKLTDELNIKDIVKDYPKSNYKDVS